MLRKLQGLAASPQGKLIRATLPISALFIFLLAVEHVDRVPKRANLCSEISNLVIGVEGDEVKPLKAADKENQIKQVDSEGIFDRLKKWIDRSLSNAKILLASKSSSCGR